MTNPNQSKPVTAEEISWLREFAEDEMPATHDLFRIQGEIKKLLAEREAIQRMLRAYHTTCQQNNWGMRDELETRFPWLRRDNNMGRGEG